MKSRHPFTLYAPCLLGALLLASGCDDKPAPKPDASKDAASKTPADKPAAKADTPKVDDKAEAKDDEAEAKDDAEATKDEAGDEKKADADAKKADDPKADAPKADTTAKPTTTTAKVDEKKDEEPKEKKPMGPVVGKQSTVVASVQAEPGYKCNDEYPHKFVTSGGSNVTYPSKKARGGCSGKRAIAVSVPYVPTAEGPGSVSGTLKYGICDDAKTNCRIVKKQMTLPFTASAAD